MDDAQCAINLQQAQRNFLCGPKGIQPAYGFRQSFLQICAMLTSAIVTIDEQPCFLCFTWISGSRFWRTTFGQDADQVFLFISALFYRNPPGTRAYTFFILFSSCSSSLPFFSLSLFFSLLSDADPVRWFAASFSHPLCARVQII